MSPTERIPQWSDAEKAAYRVAAGLADEGRLTCANLGRALACDETQSKHWWGWLRSLPSFAEEVNEP